MKQVKVEPPCEKCGKTAGDFKGARQSIRNRVLRDHKAICTGKVPHPKVEPPCEKCGKTPDDFKGRNQGYRNERLRRHKKGCDGTRVNHLAVEPPCPDCGKVAENFKGRTLGEKNAKLRRHKMTRACQYDPVKAVAHLKKHADIEPACPDCGKTVDDYAAKDPRVRSASLRLHKQNKSCQKKGGLRRKYGTIADPCPYCGLAVEDLSGKTLGSRNASLLKHIKSKACQYDYSEGNRRYAEHEPPCPNCGAIANDFEGRTPADKNGRLRRHKEKMSCLTEHPTSPGVAGVGYCFITIDKEFKFGTVSGSDPTQRLRNHRTPQSRLLAKSKDPELITPYMKDIGRWEKDLREAFRELSKKGFVQFRKGRREIVRSNYLPGCLQIAKKITEAHEQRSALLSAETPKRTTA